MRCSFTRHANDVTVIAVDNQYLSHNLYHNSWFAPDSECLFICEELCTDAIVSWSWLF